MKYRRINDFDKNQALKEYVSIVQDFSNNPNPQSLGPKLRSWSSRWKIPKENVFRYQKKIFRGLL